MWRTLDRLYRLSSPGLLMLAAGLAPLAPAQEPVPEDVFVTTEEYRENIQRVMKEYDAVMQDVAGRYKGFSRWTTQTFKEHRVWQDYLAGLQVIDCSGCPEDFTLAFERHLEATRALMASEKKMGGFSVVNRKFYKFFISGARTRAERAHDRIAELHLRSYRDVQHAVNKHLKAKTAEEVKAEAAKAAAREAAAAEAVARKAAEAEAAAPVSPPEETPAAGEAAAISAPTAGTSGAEDPVAEPTPVEAIP